MCVCNYIRKCVCVYEYRAHVFCVCVCVRVWSLRVDKYCTAQSRKLHETAYPKLKQNIPAAQLFVTSHLKRVGWQRSYA